MFIRCKKRTNPSGKTYEYAYWVANKYQKRRKMPKQKVKQYLGRVYRFEKVDNKEIETINGEENSLKENIVLLVENELQNYGFKEKEGVWQREQCIINIKQGICVDQEGKEVCIAINEGVLHRSTLGTIIAFKPKESLEREVGKQLGHALISAGIKPKETVFISLFRQIMQQLNNDQQQATPGNEPSNIRQQQATTGNTKQ